jgi:D-alanyl-D-alanine dipeptidase
MLVAMLSGQAIAANGACPDILAGAKRLVLVTAADMQTSTALLRTFRRDSLDGAWRPAHGPRPAVIGSAGMGWGAGFRDVARDGEPSKREGDKRTPAGVFAIGRSFGFAPSGRAGYLQLKKDTVCVDDPASPAYNTITSRAIVGTVRGEEMRAITLYRHGLVVEYPTDAATKAGSCIFIHVWRGPSSRTSGCVALSDGGVRALQDFAEGGAVLAVLPQAALGRMQGCLPPLEGRPPH